jgi:hypothetical protein
MSLKFISFVFILLFSSILAEDFLCKNKPEGVICSTNRICHKTKCVHKSLMPLNMNDYVLGSSMIFGSLASILSGIGGNFYM